MTGKKPGHAVIVHFFDFAKFWTNGLHDLSSLFDLEDELESALAKSGAGELDGHEIAVDGSDGYIYLYGPDAGVLFKAVEAILGASPVTQGGKATLRHGPAGDDGVLRQDIEIGSRIH